MFSLFSFDRWFSRKQPAPITPIPVVEQSQDIQITVEEVDKIVKAVIEKQETEITNKVEVEEAIAEQREELKESIDKVEEAITKQREEITQAITAEELQQAFDNKVVEVTKLTIELPNEEEIKIIDETPIVPKGKKGKKGKKGNN